MEEETSSTTMVDSFLEFPFFLTDESLNVIANKTQSLKSFIINYESNNRTISTIEYKKKLLELLESPETRIVLNYNSEKCASSESTGVTWSTLVEFVIKLKLKHLNRITFLKGIFPSFTEINDRHFQSVLTIRNYTDFSLKFNQIDSHVFLFNSVLSVLQWITCCYFNDVQYNQSLFEFVSIIVGDPFYFDFAARQEDGIAAILSILNLTLSYDPTDATQATLDAYTHMLFNLIIGLTNSPEVCSEISEQNKTTALDSIIEKSIALEFYNIVLSFQYLQPNQAKTALETIFERIIIFNIEDPRTKIKDILLNNLKILISQMVMSNYLCDTKFKGHQQEIKQSLFVVSLLINKFTHEMEKDPVFGYSSLLQTTVSHLTEFGTHDDKEVQLVKTIYTIAHESGSHYRYSSAQYSLMVVCSIYLLQFDTFPTLSERFFDKTRIFKQPKVYYTLLSLHIIFGSIEMELDVSVPELLLPLAYKAKIYNKTLFEAIIEKDDPTQVNGAQTFYCWLLFNVPIPKEDIAALFNSEEPKDVYFEAYKKAYFLDQLTNTSNSISPIMKLLPDNNVVVYIKAETRKDLIRKFVESLKDNSECTSIKSCQYGIKRYQFVVRLLQHIKEIKNEFTQFFVSELVATKSSSLVNVHQNQINQAIEQCTLYKKPLSFIESQSLSNNDNIITVLQLIISLLQTSTHHCNFHETLMFYVTSIKYPELNILPNSVSHFLTFKCYEHSVTQKLLDVLEAFAQCENCRIPDKFIFDLLKHFARNVYDVRRLFSIIKNHQFIDPMLTSMYTNLAFLFSEHTTDELLSCFIYSNDASHIQYAYEFASDTSLLLLKSRKLMLENKQFSISNNLYFPDARVQCDVDKVLDEEMGLLEIKPFSKSISEKASLVIFFCKCAKAFEKSGKSGLVTDFAITAFSFLREDEFGPFDLMIRDSVTSFKLPELFFLKWYQEKKLFSNIPYLYFNDNLSDFLKDNLIGITTLMNTGRRIEKDILGIIGYTSTRDFLQENYHIVVHAHLIKKGWRFINEDYINTYIPNHLPLLCKLMYQMDSFPLLLHYISQDTHYTSFLSFILSPQTIPTKNFVLLYKVLMKTRSQSDKLVMTALFISRCLEPQYAEQLEEILATLTENPISKYEKCYSIIFSSLLYHVKNNSNLYKKYIEKTLQKLFKHGIPEVLIDIQKKNYPDCVGYPVQFCEELTNEAYLLSYLVLPHEYRVFDNSTRNVLIYALQQLNDTTSQFLCSFSSQQYENQRTLANGIFELAHTLEERAIYLILTLQHTSEACSFILSQTRNQKVNTSLFEEYVSIRNSLMRAKDDTQLEISTPDETNPLHSFLKELYPNLIHSLKDDSILPLCSIDYRSSEITTTALLQYYSCQQAQNIKKTLDMAFQRQNPSQPPTSIQNALVPIISRQYASNQPLYSSLRTRDLVEFSLKSSLPFSALKFFDSSPTPDLAFPIYTALHAESTLPLEYIPLYDSNIPPLQDKLNYFDAFKKDPSSELKRRFLYHTASLLSKTTPDVTNFDYDAAWKGFATWPDVVFYDSTVLSKNPEYSLYCALRCDDCDNNDGKNALTQFEIQAFDSLRRGIVGEMPRSQLRSTVADCLISDVVRDVYIGSETIDKCRNVGVEFSDIRRLLEVAGIANINCTRKNALLCAKWGDYDEAVTIVKYEGGKHVEAIQLLKRIEKPDTECLLLQMKWSIDRKLEDRQRIEQLIRKASELNNNSDNKKKSKALRCFAAFYDQQYVIISELLNSDEMKSRNNICLNLEEQLNELEKIPQRSREKETIKKISDLKKKIDLFRDEFNNVPNVTYYIKLALDCYCRCIKLTDKYDLHSLFRILTLWYHNERIPEVVECVEEHFTGANPIETRKVITVLFQLVCRLNKLNKEKTELSESSKVIYKILKKAAVQHPHHVLPYLINSLRTNQTTEGTYPEPKYTKQLMETLSRDQNIGHILKQYIDHANSLIRFSYLDSKKIKCSVPFYNKHYEHVCVLTHHLDVDPSCKYDNFPYIKAYREKFENVGGINAPKKFYCLSNDGRTFTQLAKAHDDLNQDQVMQQLFTLFNSLFSTSPATQNLHIRTYKVVPLSKESGIVEYVPETMPLKNIFKKWYDKLHGNEQSFDNICNILSSSHNKGRKYYSNAFNKVYSTYQPVFQSYFNSSYGRDPRLLYDMRTNYVNSTAVISMVGYILGIGDRHTNNILFDSTTAEVVHIDFGMVFEYGKLLPVPEVVPFRLTREIVSGMGPLGINGPFLTCCENVMNVLRNGIDYIMAVLEALLFTPPKRWNDTLDTRKFKNIQSDKSNENVQSDDSKNENIKSSESVLIRCREKLCGIEKGQYLSVRGQVIEIISQAMDKNNLEKMFHGWTAWC
ncbi:non-specific serine/threonine protein kinase [Entamoeba marina]